MEKLFRINLSLNLLSLDTVRLPHLIVKKFIPISRSNIGTDKNFKRIYLSLGSPKMLFGLF